jgi:hypothetical protein
MVRCIKRPATFEAFQRGGRTPEIYPEWISNAIKAGFIDVVDKADGSRSMYVKTRSGWDEVEYGGYIVRDESSGEICPCSMNSFDKTYNLVSGQDIPVEDMARDCEIYDLGNRITRLENAIECFANNLSR